MTKPVFQILDTQLGDFIIWPVATFHFGPRHAPEVELIQVSLGNGDDSWTRLEADELPKLAGHLEAFAAELRKYHAQLKAHANEGKAQ